MSLRVRKFGKQPLERETSKSKALDVVMDDEQMDLSDLEASICSTLLSALSVSELMVDGEEEDDDACWRILETANRASRYFLKRHEAGKMKYSMRSLMSCAPCGWQPTKCFLSADWNWSSSLVMLKWPSSSISSHCNVSTPLSGF